MFNSLEFVLREEPPSPSPIDAFICTHVYISSILTQTYAHHCTKESFEQSDGALLGGQRTIGWINDLAIFRHLVSLSLSDNDLSQFPISLCAIPTLKELDLSRNKIQVVPPEIQLLEK